ncbi:MAG: 50S ribosomal protein L29 [Candidatus Omnitrophota bacterium]
MAKLKSESIRNMTEAEIEQTLAGLKEELYKLKADATAGRIEKPHRISQAKREIARCYTIIKERKSAK